jgi:RNA polymerase sigma-70 factor (ECF subfamily)
VSLTTLRELPLSDTDPAVWLDRYGDALYRFALARVRDPLVAEDLVQETLIAGMQSLSRFRQQSSELTWLTGILKHKTLDHLRAISRENRLFGSRPPEDSSGYFDAHGAWRDGVRPWPEPYESLTQKQFWHVLQECINDLPERLSYPFVLRELDAMDTEEICESLNITRNNLWVMLSRARRRMRECLNASWFAM